MLLYRLQHKHTKKFFAGIRCYDGRIMWTDSGAFYRRIDSIKKHLDYLTGEYIAREKDGFMRWTRYQYVKGPRNRRMRPTRNSTFCTGEKAVIYNRLYPSRLKLYRVVINDVEVRGERFISADKFMRKKITLSKGGSE